MARCGVCRDCRCSSWPMFRLFRPKFSFDVVPSISLLASAGSRPSFAGGAPRSDTVYYTVREQTTNYGPVAIGRSAI